MGPDEKKPREYGAGRVFKRWNSPNWYVGYNVKGKWVVESSHSPNDAVAKRILRVRMGDLESGRPVPTVRRCTFEDMAELLSNDYVNNGRRTLNRVLHSVAHLRQTFGSDKASAITTDRIEAYRAARLTEGAASATVRMELSALKRMFRLARRHGRLHEVPDFECPTPNNARQGFFEDAELRRVVEHLPEPLRPLTLFAYLTGWRWGEVRSLRWAQVDLQAGTVRLEVGTTKNGEGREFPLSPGSELDAVLRDQRRLTSELELSRGWVRPEDRVPWVFHRQGREIRTKDAAWRVACREAGVPGRLFHDLRRTAVRNLERAGVPRSWAMKLTGHKTESVYRRYAIVADQDLRDGVARLTAWQAEQRKRGAR